MNNLAFRVVGLINEYEPDTINISDTSYEKIVDDITSFFYAKQHEVVDTYGVNYLEGMTKEQLLRLREVIDAVNLWDGFYDFSYSVSSRVVTEDDLLHGRPIIKSNADYKQFSLYNHSSPNVHSYCELEIEGGRKIMTRTINWRNLQYILAFFVSNSDREMMKHYKHNGKLCHCHDSPNWLRRLRYKCSPDGLPRHIPRCELRQVFGDQKLSLLSGDAQ